MMNTNKYQKIQLALQAAFFIEGRSEKQKESLMARVAQLPATALERIMKLCVAAEKEASSIQRDYFHSMEGLLQKARELRMTAKNESLVTEKNHDMANAMDILKKLSNA